MGKSGKSPKSGGKEKGKKGKKDLGKARTEAEEECQGGSLGPSCHVDANQAKTAIILLQSPELHIVSESLVCLEKYCARRPENKVLFVDMGGVTAVKPLIYNQNVLIQLLALKIMAITSSLHSAAIQIRDFEIAKDLVEIANTGDGLYFLEYATFILSNLAMLYTGRLQIIQNGGVPVILHLLRHDDPDVQRNCADTLWRLVDEPMNVELIATKEAILSLLLLVESEYPSLQTVVLNILDKVSMTEAGIQILDSLSASMIFEKVLAKPNNGDLHPLALRVLKNLAANPEALKKVIPTTPVILRILSTSPDIPTRRQAWELLGVLVSDLNVCEALRNFGFLPQIPEVLGSKENSAIHEAAVFCLYQLSRYDSFAKIEFLEGNAIPALVGYLNSEEMTPAGFETALLALSLFFNDSRKAMPPFISSTGFTTFKKFLENNENYSVDGLISLMTCIPKMTNFDEFKTECINEGFVTAIANLLLSTECPQLIVAGAHAICGLLSEDQARKEFLDNNGYSILTALLSHNEYPVIVSAIPLIYMLATNTDVAKSLIKLGLLQEMWKRQDLICRNGPLRTSFENLISKHLPVKYGFSGHIGPFEKVGNGFYDMGSLDIKDGVPMLSDFLWANRDPQRKVIYLNWESAIPDALALEQNNSLKRVKNDDQSCHSILDTIREEMRSISSEKGLVQAVAKAVSDKFGGPLDKWRIGAHAEELEIADLQTQYESVVVPVTMLGHASFRTRAMVFKAVCDIFGIPCSLERGEYRKTWNVVLLQSKKLQMTQCPCEVKEEASQNIVFTEKLRRFVVDLVYQPGTLLPVHSHEANSYCCH